MKYNRQWSKLNRCRCWCWFFHYLTHPSHALGDQYRKTQSQWYCQSRIRPPREVCGETDESLIKILEQWKLFTKKYFCLYLCIIFKKRMISTDIPPWFETTWAMQVAGCFVWYEDSFLLLKRNDGTYGLPWWKLDTGETSTDAVLREIQEETGITLPNPEPLTRLYVIRESDNTPFIYYAFQDTLKHRVPVKLNPREHADHIWNSRKEALARSDLIHDLASTIELLYPE